MIYKTIGNLTVPAIGQGTQGIKDANIIRKGIELGLTFIDTAEVYDNEEIIGEAIKGQRDKVIISTKFSPEHNGYNDVIKSCEANLKKLGTDYIDIYSLHWYNPLFPLEETYRAFDKLKEDGKIKYVGVCNLDFNQIHAFQPQVVQYEYNLFDRSIEKDILPYCQEHNILFVAYSPFNHFYRLNPEGMLWLEEIAYNYQRPIQQVYLSWLVAHGNVITIPKTYNLNHMKVNAKATDVKLTEEEIKRIGDIFAYEVTYIDPKLIKIIKTGKYPHTIEEAKKNITNLVPSPVDLASSIDDIKPIRLERRREGFELIEGGLRYWAWVIKNGDKPIPSLILEDWTELPIDNFPKQDAVKCSKHPNTSTIEIGKIKYCMECYNEFLMKNIGALKE